MLRTVAPLILAVAAPVAAQDYPDAMQPNAAYSACVSARARTAEPGAATVDDAVAAGFARCKGQRSRALAATRARITQFGLAGG